MQNFQNHPFLNDTERHKLVDQILSLKDYWQNRARSIVEIPFYTLGAAEYLDLEESGPEYYQKYLDTMNPLLWESFQWLYQKTQNFFEDLYSAQFGYYSEKAALPGFHIFLDDDVFEIPLASRHCDLQYRQIDWQGMEYDKNLHISFTAYIKLPASGGGMRVWDYTYDDLKDLSSDEREAKLTESEFQVLHYDEGQIVLHNGHQFHQIAPTDMIQENDYRISFQGHAIKTNDGKYWFHW